MNESKKIISRFDDLDPSHSSSPLRSKEEEELLLPPRFNRTHIVR